MKENIIRIANFLFLVGGIPMLLFCFLSIVQNFIGKEYITTRFISWYGFFYVVILHFARIGEKKNSILDRENEFNILFEKK
jgi:hypothetical protein